jgi:DNA-binding MarR family transcriptional regulator
MEREVLTPNDLTWTAFVVMWVTWIWGPAETRMIASEAGISKATLSGVLNTLQARDLLTRKKDEQDGRLVVVALTPSGLRLIKRLFPKDQCCRAGGMPDAVSRRPGTYRGLPAPDGRGHR